MEFKGYTHICKHCVETDNGLEYRIDNFTLLCKIIKKYNNVYFIEKRFVNSNSIMHGRIDIKDFNFYYHPITSKECEVLRYIDNI